MGPALSWGWERSAGAVKGESAPGLPEGASFELFGRWQQFKNAFYLSRENDPLNPRVRAYCPEEL